jgi:phosphonate transport system ATP-binding protein
MLKLKRWRASWAKLNSLNGRPVYSLEAVTKQFGDLTALSNLNLEIEPRERVALIGPSGAGKTTLINLLNGSLRPSGGNLRLLGHDRAGLGTDELCRIQRRIGTVYQQFHLVHSLRVVHNVNAGMLGTWPLSKAALSLVWPQETAAAHRALSRVGIPEKLYERTGQLSGGQQQRVAIARVLRQNPDVILADEPIASLDPSHSQAIMDLLRDLCAETEKTLVVSLHSVEFAFSHCQRIIGLRAGQLMFDAPAGEVSPAMVDSLYQIDLHS